jgi:hypothetical protein
VFPDADFECEARFARNEREWAIRGGETDRFEVLRFAPDDRVFFEKTAMTPG